MKIPNIKVYIAISFILVILFILVLIIPFSKKPINNQQNNTKNFPSPTSVRTNPSISSGVNNSIPASFTGVAEEEIPQPVIDLAAQKKDLRGKTPLSLPTFTIDFDYSEDKFVVTLVNPKDQAQKDFENWRTNNYPGLAADQFLLK